MYDRPRESLRRFRPTFKKRNSLSKRQTMHLAKKKKKKLTAQMSDFPRDLSEEVLSRLPMTTLRAVRSVCKEWNTLTKNPSFAKKHVAPMEFMVVMVLNYQLCLMALNLQKDIDPSINTRGKLTEPIRVSQVHHCDGLLLCITEDFTRFLVWNPYLGQTLWLNPRNPHPRLDWYSFAIGHTNGGNYKVLRFVDSDQDTFVEYEIYKLNSNSWRPLDITSDCEIEFYARGVSLKGNTYWFSQDKDQNRIQLGGGLYDVADFLICFDFTTERFGPRLSLPFHSKVEDTVTLSSVRDEQLAVLFQRWDTLKMEIWVTTKIEPQVVSLNKLFLAVDMTPLTDFQFGVTNGSFFIDQEEKLVVVFDKDTNVSNPTRNTAYITGEDGYFREVDLGGSTEDQYPLGCRYFPSAMQIRQ